MPLHDHIAQAPLHGQFYKQDMLAYIAATMELGKSMIDIGAHLGNHTLFLAAVCQAARVDAFEANPSSYALLQENVALNGLDNIVTHQAAVGEEEAKGQMRHGPPGNSGMASVDTFIEGEVCIMPLDAVINHEVNLIKIDVEGMAGSVLRGARNVIRASHPLLYIECADAKEYDEVLSELQPLGYAPVKRFNHTPTLLFAHGTASEETLPTFQQALSL